MKKYFGFIDGVSDGAVHGWAWDPKTPTPLYIELTTRRGNRVVTRANLYREDLKSNGIGTGHHAFSVILPDEDASAASEIRARVIDSTFYLKNSAAPHRSSVLRPKIDLRRRLNALRSGKPANPSPAAPEPVAIQSAPPTALPGDFYGSIIAIEGGRIDVWYEGDPETCLPVVFVGNKPAWHDQTARIGPGRHRFYTSGISQGEEVTLWAVTGGKTVLCESRQMAEASFERAPLTQLVRAAETARQPGAVAVTCWEGGHNPVGRAKVLYDVLKPHRPVVMLCFLFDEFGGDIWPPLASVNENIVLIPWAERYFYLNLMRAMGITFGTVWMCKPRAPTFYMAAHVAAPDARLILDLDDNEEHFSRSKASRPKAYGLPTIGLCRAIMEHVPARTAASRSLVEDFDATLVRHARQRSTSDIVARPRRRRGGQHRPFRIGFIGTIRPHKRILEAAGEIRKLSDAGDTKLEFHVYGDIAPASLHAELEAAGAVVGQHVPAGKLPDFLARLDIVLSGFPSGTDADIPITRYQISAKIGDALAAGKPVLTPDGPSVSDLHAVDGIFPFTIDTFAEQLQQALDLARSGGPALPRDFTFDAAYDGFRQAEARAASSPRGHEALALVPPLELPAERLASAQRPTLLLLWKQQDGGLYGRRLDMICRAYQQAFPDHRVVVLEVLYPDIESQYLQTLSHLSEFSYIREFNIRKQQGCFTTKDGTEYHQLKLVRSDHFHDALLKFLASQVILPTNTVAVLFPHLLHLERVYDILSLYPTVTDVVDNQLGWASGAAKMRVVRQYFTLSRISDRVVFNSASNLDFFKKKRFLDPDSRKAQVIPNWYQFPAGQSAQTLTPPQTASKNSFDVFYSGNMNDRIDWPLMHKIARQDPNLRLHLIGEARRAQDELTSLLENDNVIFHGPCTEEMTLKLLSHADLTVMPHLVDDVSTYMNPLKVHMNCALGLHTLSTDVPGIEPGDHLSVHATHEAFLTSLQDRVRQRGERRPPGAEVSANARSYVALLDGLRAAALAGQDSALTKREHHAQT